MSTTSLFRRQASNNIISPNYSTTSLRSNDALGDTQISPNFKQQSESTNYIVNDIQASNYNNFPLPVLLKTHSSLTNKQLLKNYRLIQSDLSQPNNYLPLLQQYYSLQSRSHYIQLLQYCIKKFPKSKDFKLMLSEFNSNNYSDYTLDTNESKQQQPPTIQVERNVMYDYKWRHREQTKTDKNNNNNIPSPTSNQHYSTFNIRSTFGMELRTQQMKFLHQLHSEEQREREMKLHQQQQQRSRYQTDIVTDRNNDKSSMSSKVQSTNQKRTNMNSVPSTGTLPSPTQLLDLFHAHQLKLDEQIAQQKQQKIQLEFERRKSIHQTQLQEQYLQQLEVENQLQKQIIEQQNEQQQKQIELYEKKQNEIKHKELAEKEQLEQLEKQRQLQLEQQRIADEQSARIASEVSATAIRELEHNIILSMMESEKERQEEIERKRLEDERIAKQLADEEMERQRLETERLESERIENERLEREKEELRQKQLAEEAEAERVRLSLLSEVEREAELAEKVRLEEERLKLEAEKLRLEAEECEQKRQAEIQRRQARREQTQQKIQQRQIELTMQQEQHNIDMNNANKEQWITNIEPNVYFYIQPIYHVKQIANNAQSTSSPTKLFNPNAPLYYYQLLRRIANADKGRFINASSTRQYNSNYYTLIYQSPLVGQNIDVSTVVENDNKQNNTKTDFSAGSSASPVSPSSTSPSTEQIYKFEGNLLSSIDLCCQQDLRPILILIWKIDNSEGTTGKPDETDDFKCGELEVCCRQLKENGYQNIQLQQYLINRQQQKMNNIDDDSINNDTNDINSEQGNTDQNNNKTNSNNEINDNDAELMKLREAFKYQLIIPKSNKSSASQLQPSSYITFASESDMMSKSQLSQSDIDEQAKLPVSLPQYTMLTPSQLFSSCNIDRSLSQHIALQLSISCTNLRSRGFLRPVRPFMKITAFDCNHQLDFINQIDLKSLMQVIKINQNLVDERVLISAVKQYNLISRFTKHVYTSEVIPRGEDVKFQSFTISLSEFVTAMNKLVQDIILKDPSLSLEYFPLTDAFQHIIQITLYDWKRSLILNKQQPPIEIGRFYCNLYELISSSSTSDTTPQMQVANTIEQPKANVKRQFKIYSLKDDVADGNLTIDKCLIFAEQSAYNKHIQSYQQQESQQQSTDDN